MVECDQKISDKLLKARCRLMTLEPWYGQFAMQMVWVPSDMSWQKNESARTMGVRIKSNRQVECVYYPPFVDKLSLEELYAIVQHEIEHIVRLHCVRRRANLPQAWNIAADFCVNGSYNAPRIGYKEGNAPPIIPMKEDLCWIPPDWEQDGTTEQYYEKLEKHVLKFKICPKCGKCKAKGKDKNKGKGNGKDDSDEKGESGEGGGGGKGEEGGEGGGEGSGKGEGGSGCSECGSGDGFSCGDIHGKSLDDHTVWDYTEIDEDEARQLVKDMVEQSTERSRGHAPGHLTQAIAELQRPVVRWRELLRHYIGTHVGNRRVTFSRRNRRHRLFGLPGVSHHAASDVTVITDTSGSVTTKELEQFYAEIDMISSRARVHVLQWDHAFQGYGKYRRGDWKNWKIGGRGGTDMAAPVQWLKDNGKLSDVQIMLTDGECNWPEKIAGLPFIFVITRSEKHAPGPEWGNVVRMKVE